MWVDNQYVGYVKELHGEKKIVLLPGEHEISIRQAGWKNQTQKVVIEPGKGDGDHRAPRARPRCGDADDDQRNQARRDAGPRRRLPRWRVCGRRERLQGGSATGCLLKPGKHTVKIDLAGYRPFVTEVSLLPKQKITVKTDLVQGSILQPIRQSRIIKSRRKLGEVWSVRVCQTRTFFFAHVRAPKFSGCDGRRGRQEVRRGRATPRRSSPAK